MSDKLSESLKSMVKNEKSDVICHQFVPDEESWGS
jgi:hypothetical protein